MDTSFEPALHDYQDNKLYDTKFITVTVANIFFPEAVYRPTEPCRVLKSKVKSLLKIYTQRLDCEFPAEVCVVLDSLTEHCLWFEVRYGEGEETSLVRYGEGEGTSLVRYGEGEETSLEKTTEDSGKLYRAVVEEVETNMEYLDVTQRFRYHAFLLKKDNGDFKLIFPFLMIDRFDYSRLLRRLSHVVKIAEPGPVYPLHMCRTDRNRQLRFERNNPNYFHVYGFFKNGESEMVLIERDETQVLEQLDGGTKKPIRLLESYPSLFFPCVTDLKSKMMSSVRYPLVFSPNADELLGELVFAFDEDQGNDTQLYLYSTLKSKLTQEYERWPHRLFEWAKEHQDEYEFRQVCPQVRHRFEMFHPAQLPEAVQLHKSPVVDLNDSLSLSEFLTVAKEFRGDSNPELLVLRYEGKKLLCVVDEAGKCWFKAKDFTEILGYKHTKNATIRNVSCTDVTNFKDFTEETRKILPGYDSQTIFMNESGLLSLLSNSKLSTVEKLRIWITSDILPSIRKYKEYKLRKALEKRDDKMRKLTDEITELTDKMTEMKHSLVVKPQNDGDCEVFSLIEKNDGSNQKHVLITRKRNYPSNLKQQKKKYPKLEVILEIEDNPNTMNLNDRIKDWGKRSGFIQYKRKELSSTLSNSELISKIQEIHYERLK